MNDSSGTVRRFDVPFAHLVAFSFKAALAAIPALLLLFGVLVTARIALGVVGFGVERAAESAMVKRLDALPQSVQDSLYDVAVTRVGEHASLDAKAAAWKRVIAEYERRQQ